jgi:hypothetical protein
VALCCWSRSSTLKMERACSSGTSLSTNKITRPKDSENCYLNNSIHENLKTYVVASPFLQHFYPFLFYLTGINEDTNLWYFTYFWRHCVVIGKLFFFFVKKRW